MAQQLHESRPLAAQEADAAASTGRLRVQVITPGWGSSGYYSREVLESAGSARVFPAGTQMYLDHPSYSEAQDRPERSVRDLAGMLTEDAHWDDQLGALVAETQVFGPYRDVLSEMRDAIGVSIRAFGEAEVGEAEGREGQVITQLVEGVSVDFVTQAGRGGRILEVLESAATRIAAEQARTANPPVNPAGSTPKIPKEGTMQQIEEARLRQLEEAAGRVPTLESERTAAVERATTAERERDTARAQLAESRARDTARPIATTIVGESTTLPASMRNRLVEAALVGVPHFDTGELDEPRFRAAVEASRTQAETELAEALAEAGAGQVRGNGQRDTQGSGVVVDEAAFAAAIAADFGVITREG